MLALLFLGNINFPIVVYHLDCKIVKKKVVIEKKLCIEKRIKIKDLYTLKMLHAFNPICKTRGKTEI